MLGQITKTTSFPVAGELAVCTLTIYWIPVRSVVLVLQREFVNIFSFQQLVENLARVFGDSQMSAFACSI